MKSSPIGPDLRSPPVPFVQQNANIQHPTSNIERPTSNIRGESKDQNGPSFPLGSLPFDVGSSAFDVQCSPFPNEPPRPRAPPSSNCLRPCQFGLRRFLPSSLALTPRSTSNIQNPKFKISPSPAPTQKHHEQMSILQF